MAFHYPSLISREKSNFRFQRHNHGQTDKENGILRHRLQFGDADSNIKVATKQRFGQVKEKIWNYQNREVRNEWRAATNSAQAPIKGVSYQDDYHENSKDVARKSALAKNINKSKEEAPKEISSYFRRAKSKQSRMIIDKIWGHRKKEVKKEAYLESQSISPKNNFSNLVSISNQPRSFQSQLSRQSHESQSGENNRSNIKQTTISTQNERGGREDVTVFPVLSQPSDRRIDDVTRRVHGRSQDRTSESCYKCQTDRVTDRTHNRQHVNGHSQSTRTSERFSPSNPQNSQSISDRNQSESLEEDFFLIRPSERLKSEERYHAHRRPPYDSPEQRNVLHMSHDDRYIYKPSQKENYYPRNIPSLYQSSIPGSNSHAEPTNPPSFRQYRRVRDKKDINESKVYREHKSSNTNGSTNRHNKNTYHNMRHRKAHPSHKGKHHY